MRIERKTYGSLIILVTLIILSFIVVAKIMAPKEEEVKLKNGELPVIVIDTNGQELERYNEINAEMKVYENNHINNFKGTKPTLKTDIFINIRGNSSAEMPKKQYGIKLITSKEKERKESMLGLPKDNNWVLNGPYMDKSLIRNHLVYKTANNIMGYAPRTKYCEVYLNTSGEKEIEDMHYIGVYVLIEKIKAGTSRVNLSKPINYLDETSYIVLRDYAKEHDTLLDTYSKTLMIEGSGRYSNQLICDYPKGTKLTEEKLDYINKDMDEIEKSMFRKSFKDPNLGYRNYIDVESFAQFIIINEFFRNIDGAARSAYFHKEIDGKLKAGPVWDFNLSMGNAEFSNAKTVDGFEIGIMPWYEQLIKDEYFVNEIIKEYKKLRKTYLKEENLFNEIDKIVNELGAAVDRNFERWPLVYEKNVYPNPSNPETKNHEEEIKQMKKFISDRAKWMDENIESIGNSN